MKSRARRDSVSPDWGASRHLGVLDGWRGISILLVLAGHMLPIGPRSLHLNESVATAGMAIFFVLSGFLITTTLLRNASVPEFLLKRGFRILPLTWAFVALIVIAPGAPTTIVVANLLFYANASNAYLIYAPHLWSLSVEMQFYLAVAALVALGGRRALYALPALGLLVTAWRVYRGAFLGIQTLDRVDEILAGAILALILSGKRPLPTGKEVVWISVTLFFLLVGSSQLWVRHHILPLPYVRPYLAATLVALSFSLPESGYRRVLESRSLRYIASISFALYVIHPLTYSGWLGSGNSTERYLKRPLSFLLSFLGAHLSSAYFERPFTRLGHRLAARLAERKLLSKHEANDYADDPLPIAKPVRPTTEVVEIHDAKF